MCIKYGQYECKFVYLKNWYGKTNWRENPFWIISGSFGQYQYGKNITKLKLAYVRWFNFCLPDDTKAKHYGIIKKGC